MHSRLAHSWLALCQLLAKLWPIEIHSSVSMQKEMLYPLVERATKDIHAGRKEEHAGRRLNSHGRAAAFTFLLNACNHLQTVPSSEIIVQAGLQGFTNGLSSNQLDPEHSAQIFEIFCTYFVDLYGNLDAKACEQSLLSVLSKLSELNDDIRDTLSSSLSQSIINEGNSSLRTAYYKTLTEALARKHEDCLHSMSIKAISYITPSALPREQRELILNQVIELIESSPSTVMELISIATQLMEVPNATATISTDSNAIFSTAEAIHKHGQESSTTLQLLRQLVQLLLGHLIPNEAQTQNKTFFKSFSEKLDVISTASKKCSAARLSILRATIQAQKGSTLLDPLQYVELLKHCLTDGGGNDTASLLEILDAFNELPLSMMRSLNILDTTRAWLRIWINDNSDLESYMASSSQSPVEVVEYVSRLHATLARFKLYSNLPWLFSLTARLVQEPLSDGSKAAAYQAVKNALSPLPFWEKLDLVPALTTGTTPAARSTNYRILGVMITTMEDQVESNAELKQKQLAFLPNLCALLAETSDYECFNLLLNCVNTMLNDKPSLASQYSIECVLSVLLKLTSRSSPALPVEHASEIFSRLCETSRLILLVHRGRLGGRFHILLPLLQDLLFCLFIPNSMRSGALPAWLRTVAPKPPISLTPSNATQYSRLLSTLCNPPQSSITKAHQHHASRKSKDLNDPVRAAREKTSNFLYPLLAAFCRYQLSGRLDAGVREKLIPGVWEIVGTAGLHKEALDAMFAGLGRSERDVWRGIWSEWQRVHGRKQIAVQGE
jgi:nucleolar pre-ribosomal-associated protein 2